MATGTTGAVDPERAGTYVVAITPFTVDGRFDEEAVRVHLRRMAAAGIGVYVGGGGSGEGYVLSGAENRRLLEISVEELKGRVPVRAMGVEPRTSAHMIEFVEMASELRLDAVQIYSLDPGHGHRPTQDEIYRYFDDVLRSNNMPTVLSTHQSVGYQVPVAMLSEFVDRFEHLIGINCSHQDLGYLSAMIDAVGGRVDIHVGGPHLGLTALSLGANGYLSSEGNLAPRLCVGVIDAYRRDDARRLVDWHGKLLRLSNALYRAGGIRATKGVLGALGLPGGSPRLPQLPIDSDRVPQLLALIESLGIAEIEGW